MMHGRKNIKSSCECSCVCGCGAPSHPRRWWLLYSTFVIISDLTSQDTLFLAVFSTPMWDSCYCFSNVRSLCVLLSNDIFSD